MEDSLGERIQNKKNRIETYPCVSILFFIFVVYFF